MEGKIHCDICFRTASRKLPFLCATDARNQLYEPRLRHAQVLLENDALSNEIAALTSTQPATAPKSPETQATAPTAQQQAWDLERMLSERDASLDRTQQIIQKADSLRASLELARADIASKKAALAERTRSLEKAQNGLSARQQKALDDLAKATKMTTYKWNHSHALTVQSRVFLCHEAASFYGLQRVRSRDRGASDEYTIGGVRIVDLRHMNSASAVLLNTGLGHVAHLLVLVSRYLSVRLPAEITLPHAGYPRPTIFSIASSYTDVPVPFPGSTPPPSSPSSSRHHTHATSSSSAPPPLNLPRPRPLFVADALPKLARDDPAAYASFIEATALLAHDIAWLCKSQGVSISSSSSEPGKTGSSPRAPTTFEDTTAIGRNLYSLLLGGRPPPPAPSAAGVPTVASEDSGREGLGLGRYSHGARHSSLGMAGGEELVRGFRLLGPVKVADRLRKDLLAEVVGAGWEIVDGEVGGEAEEGGVGGAEKRREEGAKQHGGKADDVDGDGNGNADGDGEGRGPGLLGESFASLEREVDEPAAAPKKESNGWMKLKPRS